MYTHFPVYLAISARVSFLSLTKELKFAFGYCCKKRSKLDKGSDIMISALVSITFETPMTQTPTVKRTGYTITG